MLCSLYLISAMYKQTPFLYNMYSVKKRFPYRRQQSRRLFPMKQTYNRTLTACYTGYVVQAIVNNFVPLLFLTFQNTYHISMRSITLLITVNFLIQLMVDCLSAGFIDRIGYRASMVIAHAAAAAGLICLTFLPEIMPSPFAGLLLSVAIYALGGGLLEDHVSPLGAGSSLQSLCIPRGSSLPPRCRG